ncbi:MAG TPA: SDR family oxidoreductase [Chitinophagaceae bacterium]|jgi:NAD(P)-dependent dehydrogenase (short-subunit alcohol dehydrogenase family)|nr:SDR family oxidoreductase [Chitinophagaceae bacterium]
MQKNIPQQEIRQPQEQELPGSEQQMTPQPKFDNPNVKGAGKLKDKVAIITGGDSGIGRAVAVLFAKEGADVAIVYLSEEEDAKVTREHVEKYGRTCLTIPGDITDENFCNNAVARTVEKFGRIDILVNNAAMQVEQKNITDISTEQLMKTFTTNIISMFWFAKAVLPHMAEGSSIINTTSVTAYRGSSTLIDYASTKGAILGFTRSLSSNLSEKGIRVNAVAPGPIWTPLIPASFEPEKVAKHGSDSPMKRSGEPVEVAPSYLFLACNDDSSYITGQVIHPNGGEIING